MAQRVLRFYLHESADAAADRRRFDSLRSLVVEYPGSDGVRLFIHLLDGDKIELTLPDAGIGDALRDSGIALLGEHGGAEPLPSEPRTRGVEPVEV